MAVTTSGRETCYLMPASSADQALPQTCELSQYQDCRLGTKEQRLGGTALLHGAGGEGNPLTRRL